MQSNIQEPEVKLAEPSVRPDAPPATLMARLIPWVRKGGFAILDQGLISFGSNFLVSVLLARWMAPEQYGAYAVAFGIFVLLSLVYQSLVLEPMSVFGASSYRDCLRGYLNSLLWIHLTISGAIILIFGSSAVVAKFFLHSGVLGGALAGVSLASPCVLVFWLARRSFYLELSPARAASGAFIYSSVVVWCPVRGISRGATLSLHCFSVAGRRRIGNRDISLGTSAGKSPEDLPRSQHSRNLAAALGLWPLGLGELRRGMDPGLHLLSLAQHFRQHGAVRPTKGSDELDTAHGANQSCAIHASSSVRGGRAATAR